VRGQLELIAEVHADGDGQVGMVREQRSLAMRRDAVERALKSPHAAANLRDVSAHDAELVAVPIADAAAGSSGPNDHVGAIELSFPVGGSAVLQQGRRELLATLAAIAADFHSLSELRELRATAGVQQQAVDLLRRVQQPCDLAGTAFAIANEARRLLACDRVALLMRRGEQWRLICASGVSRVDRQSEFARLSERLAENVANWGEPVVHEGSQINGGEMAPRLATALAEHLDHSHARQLTAVPIAFESPSAGNDERTGEARGEAALRTRYDAVLIAERFDGAAEEGWQRQLIEVGELCAPALARAATLDRFPARIALEWSDRLAALRQPLHRRRALWIVSGIIACVAALTFIPAELTVEAPATLATAIEREVFASATGSVASVHVAHGQHVKQGDALIVLSDPELALKLQQVRGEIEATRQRLDALAVTRTDRTLNERETEDRLPLSAEQRQLEERLATLKAQEALLAERHDALTLRSPIAGDVLTPDVQSLLSSRPVERGQALLTIADVSSGWELKVDVPQRDVGAIVEAQAAAVASEPPSRVEASFRLSGDVAATYAAHVVAISAAAPLEAEGLEDVAPPVEVRLAVDADSPAAARPGMVASVRIDCGRRSLGYVWLHDVGATLYRWLTF
jgi:multidrug efflux pump subunit AcrA (membrane-fusion protein)